jgi:hypothetical protein
MNKPELQEMANIRSLRQWLKRLHKNQALFLLIDCDHWQRSMIVFVFEEFDNNGIYVFKWLFIICLSNFLS